MSVDPRVFERIALTRLPELQLADGLFRETVRVEGVEDAAGAAGTLRAGAVVLLGLTRAEEVGLDQPFSTGALRTRILGAMHDDGVTAGDLGLILWAESRADGGALDEINGLLQRRIGKRFGELPLDQLSWIVTGLTEASVLTAEAGVDGSLLEGAAAELAGRIVPGTGLLRDIQHRLRGTAVPVGSQFHALIALCQLARSGHAELAAEGPAALAAALLSLQSDDGAWPGLVDPQRGEAAALYPVLTVTQVALAPIALRVAGEQGVAGEPEAAADRGVSWAGGANRLGFDLIHEQEARLDRGIAPRREPGALGRGIHTAARRIRGRVKEPDPSSLILDPAVSSEDLGWVLEAWAGR